MLIVVSHIKKVKKDAYIQHVCVFSLYLDQKNDNTVMYMNSQ